VEAVRLVADRGRELLPYYEFEPDSGLWRHRAGTPVPPRSLRSISYADGTMQVDHPPSTELTGGLSGHLAEARRLIDRLAAERPTASTRASTTADFEHLRWFPYPDEVTAVS
jgi:hypothetical protein